MWLELILMQTITSMEVTHNKCNTHNMPLKRHGIKVIFCDRQWSVTVFETEYIPQQVR